MPTPVALCNVPLRLRSRERPVNQQILIQRVAYGLLAIALLAALGWADAAIARAAAGASGPWASLLRHGSVICLTCLTVYLLAAREFTVLLRQKGARPWAGWAMLAVAALIAAPWLAAAHWLDFDGHPVDPLRALLIGLLIALLGTTALAVAHARTDGALRDVAATWAVIVYLGFFGSFSTLIRCAADQPPGSGVWLLIFWVLAAKVADIGAFFIGSAFGRHKLIPRVSPGKSIEGSVGAFLFSALMIFLCVRWSAGFSGHATGGDATILSGIVGAIHNAAGVWRHGGAAWEYAGVLLTAFVVTVAAHLGDLIESCFKRDATVKDSGYVMPRFGGMLDIIDSLIISLPVAWLWVSLVSGRADSLQ